MILTWNIWTLGYLKKWYVVCDFLHLDDFDLCACKTQSLIYPFSAQLVVFASQDCITLSVSRMDGQWKEQMLDTLVTGTAEWNCHSGRFFSPSPMAHELLKWLIMYLSLYLCHTLTALFRFEQIWFFKSQSNLKQSRPTSFDSKKTVKEE